MHIQNPYFAGIEGGNIDMTPSAGLPDHLSTEQELTVQNLLLSEGVVLSEMFSKSIFLFDDEMFLSKKYQVLFPVTYNEKPLYEEAMVDLLYEENNLDVAVNVQSKSHTLVKADLDVENLVKVVLQELYIEPSC